MNELHACAATLDIEKIQCHIFLCADQTDPKCCAKVAELAFWQFLKRRSKEFGVITGTAKRTIRLNAVRPTVKSGNFGIF